MALARSRRNETGFNYWPGFVDALSTLVLSIVFLLSVFLVVQFFLSQEVTGKDKALEQLNAKLAQLNDLLSVEKLGKINLEDTISQLRAGLASTVRGYSAEDGAGGGGELHTAVMQLRTTLEEGGSNRGTTAAMANLAEAIQGLVAHMRSEQQMIREWADGQGEQNREIKKLLERIARQPENN